MPSRQSITAQIVAIRIDEIALPSPHEHIILVKLVDETMQAVGEVVAAIESGTTYYMTDGWGDGKVQDVCAHHCPVCGAWPYLTTVGDWHDEQ